MLSFLLIILDILILAALAVAVFGPQPFKRRLQQWRQRLRGQ